MRLADERFAVQQLQCSAGIVTAHVPACRVIELLDGRPATTLQHPFEAGLGGVGNDQAVTRQGAYQVVELRLDRRKIGENVGMIEFKIVEHRRPWTIVDEF